VTKYQCAKCGTTLTFDSKGIRQRCSRCGSTAAHISVELSDSLRAVDELSDQSVQQLIARGEGQEIEFKRSLSQKRPGIETLSAFAAQPQGGTVLFGVEDDGSIQPIQIGARTLENLANEIAQNTISMTSAQPLHVEIHATAGGVIAVRISPDAITESPYLAYGKRFRRSGRTTQRITVPYRRLVQLYNELLHGDPEDTGPLTELFCPECGSENLRRSSVSDAKHDEVYFTIECEECHWSNWTQ
jgi:DNA-directed RNA polymerase subunit RPC12/RpoP